MRLRLRLIAAMVLVALLPLLLIGWYATQTAVQENQRASEESLLRDASAIADFVEHWTVSQRDTLQGWTVPFELGGNPLLAQQLLDAVLIANPALVSVMLVDPDGVPIGDPRWVDARLASIDPRRSVSSEARASMLVDELEISEAIEQRAEAVRRADPLPYGGAIGDAWSHGPSEPPSLPITAIGPHDEGVVLGAEVSLADIVSVVASQSSPTHVVAIVRVDGSTVIGDGDRLEAERLKAWLATEIDSNVDYALADGTEWRGAIAVVASTRWRVIVGEPASIAMASSQAIQLFMAEILLVCVLLAFGVGAVLARSLSEPVRELSAGALKVADGDFGQTVPEDRHDEIGDLQRAFNHMSRRLFHDRAEIARQRAEIEAFNRELQERVDERTRELVEAQARLVQSGQLAAVAEMGAGLAHELNNPLAAILGMAQVVRARLRGTADEDRVARIEEQAARCREVVAAMLRVSDTSSEGGNHAAIGGVVDLRGVLAEVAALVAAPFRQRGVSLVVEPIEQPAQVAADPVAVSRILAQVLQSFRAGLPDGSRLVVRCVVTDDQAIVEFTPSQPLATGSSRDDWMASGMALWVARRQLDLLRGRLDEPTPATTSWVMSLPRVQP